MKARSFSNIFRSSVQNDALPDVEPPEGGQRNSKASTERIFAVQDLAALRVMTGETELIKEPNGVSVTELSLF